MNRNAQTGPNKALPFREPDTATIDRVAHVAADEGHALRAPCRERKRKILKRCARIFLLPFVLRPPRTQGQQIVAVTVSHL